MISNLSKCCVKTYSFPRVGGKIALDILLETTTDHFTIFYHGWFSKFILLVVNHVFWTEGDADVDDANCLLLLLAHTPYISHPAPIKPYSYILQANLD